MVTLYPPQDEANCVGAWSSGNEMTEVNISLRAPICQLYFDSITPLCILNSASLLVPKGDGSGHRARQTTSYHIGGCISSTEAAVTMSMCSVPLRRSSNRYAACTLRQCHSVDGRLCSCILCLSTISSTVKRVLCLSTHRPTTQRSTYSLL